jgi:hypothetical protein
MLDNHYRLPLFIDKTLFGNASDPFYFSDQHFLNNRLITGITIDFSSPPAPLPTPNPFNFADKDFTVTNKPTVLGVKELSIFFVTFVNDQDEIIIDNAPANLFSNINTQYPQPNTTVNNGKKLIIPTNFKINLRKSYVKRSVGPYNINNSVISFNFYYK